MEHIQRLGEVAALESSRGRLHRIAKLYRHFRMGRIRKSMYHVVFEV
jgi:hypothetical protein